MMEYRSLNHQQVQSYLPDRCPWSHKGNYGRVLLLCGSVGYTGAAAMAAMGALRAGAGLVYLGVPESIYAIEAVKLTRKSSISKHKSTVVTITIKSHKVKWV